MIRAKFEYICVMRRQTGVHDNMANCLFILSFTPCLFALLHFPLLLHFSDSSFLFSICRSTFAYLSSPAPSLSSFSLPLSLRRPRSFFLSSSLSPNVSRSRPHLLPPHNPFFPPLSSLFPNLSVHAPSFNSPSPLSPFISPSPLFPLSPLQSPSVRMCG